MTAQVPDSIEFEGQYWSIANWDGEVVDAPTNEALGIETIAPHTANWSGRINLYEVTDSGRLRLRSIDATLAPGFESVTPPGATRVDERDLTESEEEEDEDEDEDANVDANKEFDEASTGNDGAPAPDATHRDAGSRRLNEVFYCADRPIAFTGTLVLGRDFDFQYYVHGGDPSAAGYRHRALLDFRAGFLESVRFEEGAGPGPGSPERPDWV